MNTQNLSFKFSEQSPYFFNNLSVEFQPEQLNFIQGKNGSGKSTLFNILQGTLNYSAILEGNIIIDNNTYTVQNNRFEKTFTECVKTVQQDFNTMLAPTFTAMQNLQLAAIPKHPRLQYLAGSGLGPEFVQSIPQNKPVGLLSGGQRQILAICMALQKQTRVLLLDEPTAALDEKNADFVMQFLQHLAQSTPITILIITHDKELVNKYAANHYYYMHEEKNDCRTLTRAPLCS